jgi:23S rRNA-intervening sequence protein
MNTKKIVQKTVRRFEDLLVWQMAIELVKRVYLLTSSGQLKTDFGLKEDIWAKLLMTNLPIVPQTQRISV